MDSIWHMVAAKQHFPATTLTEYFSIRYDAKEEHISDGRGNGNKAESTMHASFMAFD